MQLTVQINKMLTKTTKIRDPVVTLPLEDSRAAKEIKIPR